jgi:hypothetical protein
VRRYNTAAAEVADYYLVPILAGGVYSQQGGGVFTTGGGY